MQQATRKNSRLFLVRESGTGCDDFDMIGTVTGLPVVIKGLTRPEDAATAVKAGAAAVQVSNHGGRQLDGTPATITVLPKIVDALRGSVPIIFDSGIRRGMDVAKVLALGANAVAVGRPAWWALTVGGVGGIAGLMDFFHRELVESMLHLGVDKVASARTRSRPASWNMMRLDAVMSP